MKLIFIWYRRRDLTHEQAIREWKGREHVAIVRAIPGLKTWVHNDVFDRSNPDLPDGVGELWFESSNAMQTAMNSVQAAAAMEDGKRFVDMERIQALVVGEETVVG